VFTFMEKGTRNRQNLVIDSYSCNICASADVTVNRFSCRQKQHHHSSPAPSLCDYAQCSSEALAREAR
jgi:hypothetical protein